MKIILSFIVTAFLTLPVFAQTTEAKIWKNVEALNKAIFVDKDSAALEILINNDVTYGHSGGTVEDKKVMIAKAVSNISTYKNVTTEKVSIKVIGNIVVARHILSATEIKEGKESLLKLNVLQVWQKLYGKWKLIARQAGKIVTS